MKKLFEQPRKDGCAGTRDEINGDYDCGYGTTIDCEDCMYNHLPGKKNPQAKRNQPKENDTRKN